MPWGSSRSSARDSETLPLVAFNLADEHPYDEFDIAFQLQAERGCVPASAMPPKPRTWKMMRALVKLNLARSLVDPSRRHREAIETLEAKGPLSESERKRVQTTRATERARGLPGQPAGEDLLDQLGAIAGARNFRASSDSIAASSSPVHGHLHRHEALGGVIAVRGGLLGLGLGFLLCRR